MKRRKRRSPSKRQLSARTQNIQVDRKLSLRGVLVQTINQSSNLSNFESMSFAVKPKIYLCPKHWSSINQTTEFSSYTLFAPPWHIYFSHPILSPYFYSRWSFPPALAYSRIEEQNQTHKVEKKKRRVPLTPFASSILSFRPNTSSPPFLYPVFTYSLSTPFKLGRGKRKGKGTGG